MDTRKRGKLGPIGAALRLEVFGARERAARVRTWPANVLQDDLRADLIRYAVRLEDKASGLDQEADELETSR